jgi:tripartite ATP-independent transporter DctM subunit
MDAATLVLAIFGVMLVYFVLGAQVGFALGGLAMAFAAVFWGPQAFNLIPTTVQNSTTNFLLLAIPLFIFLGQVLMRSGLGEAMFHSVHVFAGRLRGGLAIGVILVCCLISAMVGIIGAGIMTAGTVALPPMLRKGYNRYLALGTIMAGGGLGILIPPSIPMVLYAAMTKASLGQMFAGSLIPAAILVTLFILYIAIRCWLRPQDGPALTKEELGTFKDKVIAARNGALAFILIFFVLGTILLGMATPTEAGAMGAFGACILALFFRKFGWKELKESSIGTMRLTAICIWILIGATVLSNFNLLMGAGNLVKGMFVDMGLGPLGTVAMMQFIMIVLGCFIDEYVIVLICAPLFTPIVVALGYDPVWFGILMILNLEIAIQTPPYGFALFYLKGVAPPDVTMLDIYKSITPFVLLKIVTLALCMFVPETITWLPGEIFGTHTPGG